jgi:hypothetical protein
MQIKTSAAGARAHSPLVIGLTAVAGFVAGACLVGLAKFQPEPIVSSGTHDRGSVAAPAASPYESATPEPRGGPGAKRSEPLSAPEGWINSP